MLDPLGSIDRWASQSGDRSTLMLWLVVIGLVLLVGLAILGVIWFTAPPPAAPQ